MDPEPLSEVLATVTPGILSYSAKTGIGLGIVGLCFGGVIGTVKKSTPILWSLASGVQCSALGATWGASKSFADIYQARRNGTDVASLTNRQITASNTVAGASAGAVTGALFRGRANVLPGMLVFGSVSFLTSILLDRRRSKEAEKLGQEATPSLGYRALHSRFNPMKVLSDEEYERMLQEKLIRVEAEIALIDENIEKVKGQGSANPTDARD